MIPRRILDYFDHAQYRAGRFDLDSVSHVVTGRTLRSTFVPNEPVGDAFLHVNPNALPRARLAGRPAYAEGREEAVETLTRLGPEVQERLVVEDPARPLDADARVAGTAKIETDLPEEVVVSVSAETPAYLVLADTFDPGWSATVDGEPAAIVPAYVAFRAVFVKPGSHRIVFRYAPAGFAAGLAATAVGCLLALGCMLRPGSATATPDHVVMAGAGRLKAVWLAAAILVVVASIPRLGPTGVSVQSRWGRAWHTFTWGAGLEAMHENRR
nr:YfhO family protein [Paludisphaera mucosa]